MESATLILFIFLAGQLALATIDCGPQCPDRDRDGVIDEIDQCSDSEPGAPVTIFGCAHDTDGDDVPDYRDDCPQQAAESVDAWGCPAAIEIALPAVSFEINSARLLRSSHATLIDTANMLKRYENLQAEIAGHTDDSGSAEHNRQLSRMRAEAVRRFLIDSGIDSDRIVARGYGESRPVDNNETEDGRSTNRRVVLRILGGTLKDVER